MQTLKYLTIALVTIIAIALIVALFLKKEYTVERQITIDLPKDSIYNYIKYLKNQNNYSKWASMDTQMKKEFKGTDGTIGFVSAWDSYKKEVGKGEQTIKAMLENERIEYNIHFIKPFEGFADACMTLDSIGTKQTIVRWGFVGKMKYPMNLMLLFMNMDKMIGDDLSIGLTNLKDLLEKK